MEAEKGLQDVATPGVLSSDASQVSVPVEPYSIYSRNEKWFIVAVVALAGFYRHARLNPPRRSPPSEDFCF